MLRRLSASVSGFLVCAAIGLVMAPPASAGAYCGQVWGSGPEVVGQATDVDRVAIRTGRHACFDRFVLEFDGVLAGYAVRYNADPWRMTSGARAALAVTAYSHTGPTTTVLTSIPVLDVPGYRTFRGVRRTHPSSDAYELDLRARLPFRAFVLDGPDGGSRLVVDVGHRWCSAGQSRC